MIRSALLALALLAVDCGGEHAPAVDAGADAGAPDAACCAPAARWCCPLPADCADLTACCCPR